MRRKFLPIVLLVAVASGWLAFCIYERRRMAPPQTALHLRGFLAEMRAPDHFAVLNVEGQQYLLVTGPLPSLNSLPSGPPQYVFDASGRLVDWTTDSGEDPDFVADWSATIVRAGLTSDEALTLFGR